VWKISQGGRAANQHLDNYDPLDPFADDELEEPGSARPIRNLNAARVLILNASYEPLHVCSVKRAVMLLMHEVAERVEDSEQVLRSPSQTFPVPSVIRLRKFVKRPPRHRVAFNRKNVFRRDDNTCQYCGNKSNDLTLDHVLPRSRGGPTSWENVVACCRRCNAKKRDRTPDEAKMSSLHVLVRVRHPAEHRPHLEEVPAALGLGVAGLGATVLVLDEHAQHRTDDRQDNGANNGSAKPRQLERCQGSHDA
jgi:5-methylcytosine-specific restriction endonuclease McrA